MNYNSYDAYNREERMICSHLFRLLHENLDQEMNSPLGQILKILFEKGLRFNNGKKELEELKFKKIAIYTEVAMIRDAYHSCNKENRIQFMDRLVEKVIQQENVSKCKLYSQLQDILKNPSETHPNQIRRKAKDKGIFLSPEEEIVYGAVQGLFNAKPDMAICVDDVLLVCEAKYTIDFDKEQMERTEKIANIWANLLYRDLGFEKEPFYAVFKLGANRFNPDVAWNKIAEIANKTYQEADRTRICLNLGIELL